MNLENILSDFKSGNLEILDLRDVDLSKEDPAILTSLAEIIRSAPKLKEISFFNTNLGQVLVKNLDPIFVAIRIRSAPLALNLAANDLGTAPEVFTHILTQLLQSTVTTLDLDSNQLSLLPQETIEELCRTIRDNDSLKELRLSSNHLGESKDKNLLLFGQLILKCKNLKILNLSDDDLGNNPTIKDFLTLLHGLNLTHLDLSSNNLCNLYAIDKGTQDLDFFINCLMLIAHHPSLQNLCLADNLLCGWGTDYLELFFSKILENKTLRSLNLNANQFAVLITEESEKDFMSKFITFIRKASDSHLTITYESGNFNTLKELDQIVINSGVSSAFWQETRRHLTLEDAAKEASNTLRSYPPIQTILKNPATLQLFLTKLGESLAPQHTATESMQEKSVPSP